CGPRRGWRGGSGRGWWGWRGPNRGPMPPSSPVAGSGVWRTAQRTSRNSATIGIFRQAISQMKVHVSTAPIVYPAAAAHNPHPPSGGAAEMRHRAQLAQPRDDLLASQALHALGTELLDVERGQDRRVSHRPAQQLVAEPAGAVGRDVAHEAAGERIAGAGGIDHGLER